MTKATPNSIIMGDSNNHSSLWDPIQPAIARGNKLEEWICNLDLDILNEVVSQATTAP